MSTTASNVAIGGTLTVTGGTTLSSTLAVSGGTTVAALTASGAVNLNSTVGMGPAAALAAINDYATTYTWAKLDGTNSFTVPEFRVYDWGTNAYRRIYLHNGTFYAV